MSWIKSTWDKAVKDAATPRKQRWMAALLLGIAGLIFFRTGSFDFQQSLIAYILIGVAAVSFVLPWLLFPILCVWFFIGSLFGEIASFVLLTLVYFLAAWPISIFRKKNTQSGWIERTEEPHDYSKPY